MAKKTEVKMSISATQRNNIARAYVACTQEHNDTGLRLVSRLMHACDGVTLNVEDARAVATQCADTLKWNAKSIPVRASEIRAMVNAGDNLITVMKRYMAKSASKSGLSWNGALTAARMLKTQSVNAVVTSLTTKRPAKKTTGKTAAANALKAWLKSSPKNADSIRKAAKLLGISL